MNVEEIKAAVSAVVREIIREELATFASAPRRIGALSVIEAAELAHRNPETIRRAIKSGILAATKPERGREWLIQEAELRRWMTAQRPHVDRALDISAEVAEAVARARGA